MNRIKKSLILSSAAILMHAAHAEELAKPALQWSSSGFAHPESVAYDTKRDNFYVTNNDGGPMAQDGKAYISRLGKNGELLERSWVRGLNAPKGIAQYEDSLYIADIQQLRVVDIPTGKVTQTITAEDSKMLNDVSVDEQGNVYVSDVVGGGIFRLQGQTLAKWVESDAFSHPNGLFVDGNRLLVVNWGEGMREDFSTDTLGGIYAVDIATKKVEPLPGAQQIGNLDGITKIRGNIIVSDMLAGKIMQYSNGQTKLLFDSGKGSADIASYGDNLLVPVMPEGKIDSYTFKP
ncbi:SMP-30/gluconolactonase/LRE family protein [Neisseria montereyensis]|uniref:ATP/GTP-binding protein n=1 Tax=Neisseria montereyensis TaxID=2973938 RepID=A0ABT2FC22_9NEIS|nr:hypothetical protein [Neisseria montereyensis]MCS4533294.1 hypothetical protein [Neisseria montereyensis]